ncbi:hypothetical protein GURASL_11760 [Geotalea uraniireducens]|uniref:P pilus assembly/Cpx signaling pathway, periplasmic inhibitor/zinc-resistance associated protein n=1 Tax=Geotalea uraniireducens TaxID=351604 RepID=A0ABM8EIN9_9BACT|nr:hypothetical protein [Geotalea uraniireducens]BDV42253.1 hypothetical protein GURASL_11760 [Geotalea uraniireducens]
MSNLKRLAVLIAAAATLAATALPAAAQQGMGMGPGAGAGARQGQVQKNIPESRLERMAVRLNLTAEQKEKILPILQEEYNEIKTMRNDTTLTRQQRQQKMQELRDRYHNRVKELLTPAQQQQADAMRQQARERWERRKQPAPPQQ